MIKRPPPLGFAGHARVGGHRRSAAVLAAMLLLVACADGTAAPPGRLGQSFEIEIRDTSWEGRVFGFVDIPPVSVDAPGCVALLGEIRPTSLPGVVSSGLRVPSIGLSAGQTRLREATPSSCDIGNLEAAGYGPIRDTRVTVGTTYRFHRVFRLPAGTVPPKGPMVGSVADPFEASGHVVESFEPRLLTSLPSPKLPSPVPVTDHHTLLPAGSDFAYPDGATPWAGTVLGLINAEQVPVPPLFETGAAAARSGRCVLILGWLRAGGAPVGGSLAKPSIGLIADGRLVGTGGRGKLERCDTTRPAFTGFGHINKLSTTVTADGYPFYQQIFIPETISGVPEAITVRYPWSKNQWFLFAPTVLPRLPDSPTDGSARSQSDVLLPAGDPALSTFHSGFGFSRQGQSDSATTTAAVEWEGLIRGLVRIPTSPELNDTHRCLAVVGTITVTRFEGFDLTMPPLRPDLGLMLDGRRINPSSPERCDTSRMQEAGYRWFGATGDPAGNDESFYETFIVTADDADRVQAVAAGSVWFSDFRFFEPTTLRTIPDA